jgi:Flp pilus assembly protein TadG
VDRPTIRAEVLHRSSSRHEVATMRDRLKQGEQGQIVALLAVALLSLLAMSALVMDVGFTWYAKRQAQAQVDAAALAAAQELPDQANATAQFNAYLAKNPLPGGVTTDPSNPPTITFSKLQGSRASAPYNKVTVSETGTIPSILGRWIGVNSFGYSVKSTACEPCGNKRFDIVLVIDRTGSMCLDPAGHADCSDLNNAKAGMQVLFQTMDAKLDAIGIVDFPPVPVTSQGACEPVPGTGSDAYSWGQYDNPSYTFMADTLRQDYQNSDGTPNTGSTLYQHTAANGCIPAGGGTSYSQALQAGIDELNKDGRTGATKVIIFMTDGAANTGPARSCTVGPYAGMPGCTSLPATNIQNTNPCQAAINVANAAKAAGVDFYSIAYGLATTGDDTHCWRGLWVTSSGSYTLTPPRSTDPAYNHRPGNGVTSPNAMESPALSPKQTLDSIASTTTQSYNASQANITQVFQQIASDIEKGRSHLVDDGA